MTRPFIAFQGVSKSFLNKANVVMPTLQDVSFEVADGEFVTIVGPSGCGKSTTLNLLAGLTGPTRGRVLVDGNPVGTGRLDTGYVFQQDSVLPWKSVEDNVAIGLRLRGVPATERRDRVGQLLRMTGLADFARSFPAELSGGMRKRTALAATLAYDPRLLLMDEPFGALDAQTRIVLQDELLRVWSERRQTVLFVTHDIGEAILLADRVIVMTARPARIKAQYRVDVPRPRHAASAKFDPGHEALYQTIWQDLQPELAEQTPSRMTPMDGAGPAHVLDSDLVAQSLALRRGLARRRLLDRLVLYALLFGAWEAVVRLDWIGAFFISSTFAHRRG